MSRLVCAVNTTFQELWNYNYTKDTALVEALSNQPMYFGFLMYVVPRKTTLDLMDSYRKPGALRDIANDVMPAMTILILGEFLLTRVFKQRWMQPAEAFPSVGHGIILQTFRLLLHASEFALYEWAYEKWHLLPDGIQWDTWYAWLFVMVTLDLCYYVFHRTAHEMAFLWSFHQVHHSSNSFNLAAAIRIPHLHDFAHFGIYYVPLAFIGVPPKVGFMHKTLNLLYQFWTHTELIPKLVWPIEYIFNTPSHHRVHHGRNPKYIDKNYGSLFIIWDRMFGTFQEEEEQVVYGLTKPIETLDIATTQYCGFVELYNKMKEQKTWSESFQAFIKGPGWEPGTSWKGNPAKIPEVDVRERATYPELSWFWHIYIWGQYMTFSGLFGIFLLRHELVPDYVLITMIVYMYFAGWSTAAVMEKKIYGAFLEMIRCIISWSFEPFVISFFSNFSPIERIICRLCSIATTISITSLSIFILDRIRFKVQRKS